MRLERDEEIVRQVEIMRAMQAAKERKERLRGWAMRGKESMEEERQVEIMRAMQAAKERKERLRGWVVEITEEERQWRTEKEEEEREDREERNEMVARQVELALAQREAEDRRERLRRLAVSMWEEREGERRQRVFEAARTWEGDF